MESKRIGKDITPQILKVYSSKTGNIWKEVRDTLEDNQDGVLKKEWEDSLIDLLESQNLILLSGSGTSLGEKVKGPSMATFYEGVKALEMFEDVLDIVKHDRDDKNIEVLLSRSHTSLQFLEEELKTKVTSFIEEAEKHIAQTCRDFLHKADLSTHETMLRRLSRRSPLKPRLRLFTTNYDLCFEQAASHIECPIIDGFSYSIPQRFSPRYFIYDFVRRSFNRNESPEYVEGVFHLYKIHGSVDWKRLSDGGIEKDDKTDKPCLIYPASTKYEHSYAQPHLEMMSQLLTALREPNTTLLIIGFGFNDAHLSQPILSAIHSNSGLRLIFVDSECEKKVASENDAKYHRELKAFIDENDDRITLVNATFDNFVSKIPDLSRQTEEERLARVVERIAQRTK